MFSFFKKKDSDADTVEQTAPVVPRPAAAPAARPVSPAVPAAAREPEPPAQLADDDRDGFSGIEVSAGDSLLSPAEEQAAILHANGGSASAIPILQAELPEVRGQRRLETWLMLFELYQQKGDRAAFESLGLEFVVEFEKTPPIWLLRKTAPAKAAQPAGNTCNFGAKLTDETIAKELAAFRTASTRIDAIRLDFSKVKEIDSMAAAELLAIWQIAKKVSAQRQVLGGVAFTQLLSGKIETGRLQPAEAPFWLLLIELHQALGQHEEFENLAVEYAITFEVSPPSWDPRFAPKQADKAAAAAENARAAIQPAREGLLLTGEISSQNPQGVAEIRDYAQRNANAILLDFEYVDRVDFESAGQFLNLFMDFLQKGRQVKIVNANELVLALLRLMGVADLVTVERRKT